MRVRPERAGRGLGGRRGASKSGWKLTLSGGPLQVPDDIEVAGAFWAEGQQDQLQESRQHRDAQE